MPRKIGICVGQNKYAPSSGVQPELHGCINDALLIGEMLRKAGYEVRQIHNEEATQQGILTALENEVAKLRDGDFLVFWNASHGYQVQDQSPGGDEFDFKDEAICCYDNNIRDPLIDDKFQQILSRVNPNATVFIGSDSCHSGTVTRELMRALAGLPSEVDDQAGTRGSDDQRSLSAQQLAWEIVARDARVRSMQSLIGEPRSDISAYTIALNIARSREIARSLVPIDVSPSLTEPSINDPVGDDRQARLFIPSRLDLLFDLGQNVLNLADYISHVQEQQNRGESPIDLGAFVDMEKLIRRFGGLARSIQEKDMSHVLLSACLPEEACWDAPFQQGWHGAMTYYFAVTVLEAWRRGQAITYREAHQEASRRLGQHFYQHPQLEGPDRLKDLPVFGYKPA